MIRVVVTGSECTGKTTLAGAIAEHYDTVRVPEYVRRFVLAKGAPPEFEDVEAIARGQIALEETFLPRARGLLVQDTDLLSTVVYSRHYYGRCPAWIEDDLRRRRADLYLLAGIDVPWVADDEQRDRGDRREEMQNLFVSALEGNAMRYVEIHGSPAGRLRTAVREIEALS